MTLCYNHPLKKYSIDNKILKRFFEKIMFSVIFMHLLKFIVSSSILIQVRNIDISGLSILITIPVHQGLYRENTKCPIQMSSYITSHYFLTQLNIKLLQLISGVNDLCPLPLKAAHTYSILFSLRLSAWLP